MAESAATAVAILVVEAGVRASPELVPYSRLPVATSTTAAERRPSAGDFSSGSSRPARVLAAGADRAVVAVPPSPVSTEAAGGAVRGPFGGVPAFARLPP